MVLRKYLFSDADEIASWISSERELRLWASDRYDSYPLSSSLINDNYEECQKNMNFYPLTYVNGNEIIGHLIIRNPDYDLKEFRLGFIIINPKYRRYGYGRKMILDAIEYAKREFNAKRFSLGVFANNDSAFNCYKSVGFEKIKIDENAFQFYDESWDCIEMNMISK